MKELYRSEYCAILYDSNRSFLEHILFETAEDMTEEDFKNDLRMYSQFVQQLDIKFVLLDLRNFYYIIVPDLQAWIDDEIATVEKRILKKQAVILPQEMIASLGIEQTVTEPHSQEINVKMVRTREQALVWMELTKVD